MSLRTRLLLGTLVIAVVLAASAIVIARTTRSHLVAQVDEQLQDARPRLRDGGPGDPPAGPGAGAPNGPRLSNLYVGVINRRGVLTTVYAPDLRGDTAPVPTVDAGDVAALRSGRTITVGSDARRTSYRMVARAEGPLGAMSVLALSLDDVDDAVRRLVVVEGLAVLSVLAVLALVTWWVIHLGVRPIRRMTETASAIAGGDLSMRVAEGAAGTEAGALGAALNGMLGRIEEAFDQRTESEGRLRQFVADASHELRTPVTTIRGYAELYRAGALDDPEQLSEAMRRTEQEAVRMGSLVDDLLHLARLDQGRPLERTPVDLVALADDAVRDARAVAPDRTITLVAEGPVVVPGDEARLRQVVANLVGNAVVHADPSPVEVHVRREGDAVVEVVDHGPGMAAADAARAFERFYRADASRSRHHGGSGLGLAIVEATVRAHGGTVELTSVAGAGTTVRVVLPLDVPAPAAPTDQVSPAAARGGAPAAP
jgi:two-component system OmpR family sensor kinase